MKNVSTVVLSLLASTALMGAEDLYLPEQGPVFPSEYGAITGHLKYIQVLKGEDNGFDLNTGSAYLVNLGYVTPEFYSFSAKVSGSIVGDTGLTDKDKKVAAGLFMGKVSEDVTDTYAGLSESYLQYKNPNVYGRVGIYEFHTPMTQIMYSTEPNLYEGVIVGTKTLLPETHLVGSYLTRMRYGARTAADWGIIGEKVGMMTGASSWAKEHRGEFEDFGTIAGADSAGMAIAGIVNNSVPKTTLQAWNYYVSDLVNTVYADGLTKLKAGKSVKMSFGAQFIYQKIDGGDSPTVWGAKAAIAFKGAKLVVGYNRSSGSSTSDYFINPWGGDPLYTWSIFSRNAFRPDVSAYKVTGSYKIPVLKGLVLVASYADYGQSALANVQNDATELDFIVKWQISKNLMLKLFNAQRTSEFDFPTGEDKTQNHTRFIASYKF